MSLISVLFFARPAGAGAPRRGGRATHSYASIVRQLARHFLEVKRSLATQPATKTGSSIALLRELHTTLKNIPFRDEESALHWRVNEAMRHDIAAADTAEDPRLHQAHREQAERYWQEVERRDQTSRPGGTGVHRHTAGYF